MDYKLDGATKTLICRFSEKMDTVKSNEANENFMEAMGKAASSGFTTDALKIIFDLEQVDYVASAFLRLCLIAVKGVGERNFIIINTEPEVMKVFKIAGLDQILQVS
jgi:anti-anti-sigma factor